MDGDDWDDYLQIIQHSYNSTPNSMTSHSPNKILFGKDLEIALDKINNKPLSRRAPNEYIEAMNNMRTIINNEVDKNAQKYSKQRTKSYNKERADSIEYVVGDLVLVDMARRVVGNDKSLRPQWVGPFEVVEDVGNKGQQYWLREVGNEGNKRRENVHALKPYRKSAYVAVLESCCDYPIHCMTFDKDVVIRYVYKKYAQFDGRLNRLKSKD